MGWMTGFEPATSWATTKRSNQLSYNHHEFGKAGNIQGYSHISTDFLACNPPYLHCAVEEGLDVLPLEAWIHFQVEP